MTASRGSGVIALCALSVGCSAGGEHANLSRDQVEVIASEYEAEANGLTESFGGETADWGEPQFDKDYSANGGEIWIVEWRAQGLYRPCLIVWSPNPDSDRYYSQVC